jgi:hypothetical protein
MLKKTVLLIRTMGDELDAPTILTQGASAILLALALSTFLLGLSASSMMPMLPSISETFFSPSSQSGCAIRAYGIGPLGIAHFNADHGYHKNRHFFAVF